jgi:hypothetical protein
MSKRDRRDSDGRDRDRRDDRRDYQDDEGQQRRMGEGDIQESDSLTALKAILSKVASALRPLNLTADEAIRLVEQLYGSVLDMDVALAGEADDTRKSSTLAYIYKTTIRRDGDKLVVEFPTAEELRRGDAPPAEAAAPAAAPAPGPQAPAQAAPAPAPAPAAKPVAASEAAGEPTPAPAPRPARPRPAPRPAPRKEQIEAAPQESSESLEA